jgi:serine/threonine protein kinase
MSPAAPSPKGLAPGEVFGRYAIESLLGTGGMARVYQARDTALNRVVALKILHEPDDQDFSTPSTGGPDRIVREARALAALEHPNVVSVYDVGVLAEGAHAGTAYLTMELVRGRSLRAVIADKSVPLDVRVRWLRDAARGLAAAHACGVIHRDVKPDNILVRSDGVVKVLDFGIAKSSARAPLSTGPVVAPNGELGTLTGAGIVLGTPYYMSPEQMRGELLDARSDQFSWGVVAFQVLTGVTPWGDGLDAVHLIAQVLGKAPPQASEKNPDVPAWLSSVVDRALAKDPDARFASMDHVVDALDVRALGGATTETLAGPLVAPRPAAISIVRRVTVTLASIALLVVVVVGSTKWSGEPDVGATTPVAPAPSGARVTVAPSPADDASALVATTRSEVHTDAGVLDAAPSVAPSSTRPPRLRHPGASSPVSSSRIDPFGDQK